MGGVDRYVITVRVYQEEVVVDVEKNGRFYDEVSFHPSNIEYFVGYMALLANKIITRGD